MTRAQENRILQMITQGYTYPEICEIENVTRWDVHVVTQRNGINGMRTSQRRRICERRRAVWELYHQDLHIKQIAQELECGVITVRRDLRAMGITREMTEARQQEWAQLAKRKRRRKVARLMDAFTYEEMARILGVSSKTIQHDVYAVVERVEGAFEDDK